MHWHLSKSFLALTSTDLASLDLYALDSEELAGYASRHFQKDAITEPLLTRLLKAAALASLLRWNKIACVPDGTLADIEGSLSIDDGIVQIDLAHWIGRSRGRGGTQAQWDALLACVVKIEAAQYADDRQFISVHLLDEIFRHWMKQHNGVKIEPAWMEGHLRGMATFDRLRNFDFFRALAHHCAGELAAP